MDESRLLRNSPMVHANMRDPEEILTRLGHFWDAHGLSKHVLDPRGPMTGKFVVLEQDRRPPVPDTRPNMPGGPTPLIRHSSFNVGFEGGLTDLESQALSSATYGTDVMRKDYPSLLSPVNYARNSYHYNSRGIPQTTTRSHLFAISSIPNINASGTDLDHMRSPSDFWREHDKQVQVKRDLLTDIGYGQDKQSLHEAMRSDRFKDELEANRNSHIAGLVTGDDPRYLDVEFDLKGEHRNPSDRIDLSTGTWAKISPGQFFPVSMPW